MTTSPAQEANQITNVLGPAFSSIYVEGISQILVGFPNSRVQLHSLVQRQVNGDQVSETRQIACELVMPTSSMIEIAQILINNLFANKAALETGQAEWISKLGAITESLQHIDSPVTHSITTKKD
jgi:hypothetical protein